MPSGENEIVVACAGSGKTTMLVHRALSNPGRQIAIVTYTINNLREIASRFASQNSGVPKHVELWSWYAFLLRECVRPYQRAKYKGPRVESIVWVQGRSPYWIPESNVGNFYFASGGQIYQDKIAQFVVECERLSGCRVTRRLRRMYSDVYIDEFQDLSGWDLELIKLLMASDIRITLVGDPRQTVFKTNNSAKNAKYRKAAVTELIENWEQDGLCTITSSSGNYRCHQGICDFANRLWPAMEEMKAMTNHVTGHDGVFLIKPSDVSDYIARFSPQVLRWDKNAESYGCRAINFGKAKGLQFNRVLITPTQPMLKYLKTGDLKHVLPSLDKLHVAVTRARHSVAFVLDGNSDLVPSRWASS